MPPYVKLMLKMRLKSFNPFALFGMDPSRKKKIVAAFALLLYGIMTAGYLTFFEYHMFQAFVQFGEPETILATVVVASSLVVMLLGFFYMLSELFFTKDLAFVSALPIPSRQMLAAKILRVWMGEALIALAVCLPVIIMYGIHVGKGIAYYVTSALLVLTIPLLPLVLVALLSFVAVRLSSLWKHREALTMIFSVGFIFLIVFGQMKLSSALNTASTANMMTQLVQGQHALLSNLSGIYPPAGWFTLALTDNGISGALYWLLFAAVNIGALALVVFILGGSYQQLAVRQSEARVRADASHRRVHGEQGVRTPLQALYRREIKEILTSPTYALNCLVGGILFPIMVVAFSSNKQGGLGQLSALLPLTAEHPQVLPIAVCTGLFALTGSMNMGAATAVSREGKRHSFYLTLPVPAKEILLSKLYMGMTISVLITLPMAITLAVLVPDFTVQIAVGFAVSQMLILGTTSISLMQDIKHPKFGWRSETEAIKQNWVAALSMFGGMGVIASCGVLLYLATTIGISLTFGFPVLCALIALVDLWLLRRLFSNGTQAYLRAETNAG